MESRREKHTLNDNSKKEKHKKYNSEIKEIKNVNPKQQYSLVNNTKKTEGKIIRKI